jgi:hypothetical protein
MIAKDKFRRIMSEKTFVTGEMAEKPIAFPIAQLPGCIPSTIIGTAPYLFKKGY